MNNASTPKSELEILAEAYQELQIQIPSHELLQLGGLDYNGGRIGIFLSTGYLERFQNPHEPMKKGFTKYFHALKEATKNRSSPALDDLLS